MSAGQHLVETLDRELSDVLTAVMTRVGAAQGLPPLLWRVDDLRAVERPALLPRLAIAGRPSVGVDVAGARRWADELGLAEYPSRVRDVLEWRGDVDGMAVRVWALTPEVGS